MVFFRLRARLIPLVMLAPILIACSAATAGSAQPTAGSAQPTAGSAQPTAGSAQPIRGSTSTAASASSTAGVSRPAGSPVDRTTGVVSTGDWASADVRSGPVGIASPTGDLVAVPDGNQICFRTIAGGPDHCGSLAADDRPVFTVYSPDGSRLLLVAGPDGSVDRSIYILGTGDGAVQAVGPSGVTAAGPGAPPRWDLSTIAWSADGRSVVIVPRTDSESGSVFSADLVTGSVTEIGSLSADLANSRPSVWPTGHGTAWVANSGQNRQTLWWQDADSATVTDIARFDADGGSLYLSAADPLGRVVVACPRSPDGRLGASVYVGVENRKSGRLLPDSASCAGAVFSADGQYLAAMARLNSGYSLLVIEVLTNRRVLTVPLSVPEPSKPPYLTWLDDVVVASDVSGLWSAPSLIIRLRR